MVQLAEVPLVEAVNDHPYASPYSEDRSAERIHQGGKDADLVLFDDNIHVTHTNNEEMLYSENNKDVITFTKDALAVKLFPQGLIWAKRPLEMFQKPFNS